MAFAGDGRARRVGEQALEFARRLGDKRLLSHALVAMMFQPIAPGSTDHWLALAAELAPLARESEDWEALGIAAIFRAAIAYVHADPDAWSDAIADMDRAIRGSGQPLLAYLRGCSDYARAFLRGDFAAAERIAEDLLEIGRSFGSDAAEGPYGLQMYMVRRETGALEAVRPLVDVARQAQATWEPGLLALYTELGLTGPAQSLLRRLLELGRFAGSVVLVGTVDRRPRLPRRGGGRAARCRRRPAAAARAGPVHRLAACRRPVRRALRPR